MQKTAYDMRISVWSSDVCSSDLVGIVERGLEIIHQVAQPRKPVRLDDCDHAANSAFARRREHRPDFDRMMGVIIDDRCPIGRASSRESVCKYVLLSGAAGYLKKK